MIRSGRFGAALLTIAALAVVLRLAHVGFVLRGPFGEALVQDERLYHDAALRILGRIPRGIGDATPFNNLGYPYVLAAVYALAGARPGAAMIAQALLGGTSVALLGLAVRDLTEDPLASLAAASAYALSRTALFYDGALLTPAATNVAMIAGVWGIARWARTGRIGWLAVGGAGFGGATLLRTNLVLALPFAALAVLLPGRNASARGRPGLAAAGLFAACALAGPVAVGAATAARTGALVPLTANGGMNFWLGNNASAQGVYTVAPFLGNGGAAAEADRYLEEARRRTNDPGLTLSGASRFWFAEGWRAITASPARSLRLWARKAALFGCAAEPQTNLSLEVVSAFSPVLRAAPIRVPILTILGAAGLALLAARGEWQALALLGALVAAAWITCVVFFVSGEYRHAAAPALAGGMGILLAALARPARERRSSWLGATLAACLAAAAALLPWPALAVAMPPELTAGDLVRALVAERSRDGRADATTFGRAEALLAAAPASRAGRIFRLDTASWLASRAAEDLGERPRAAAALGAAAALLALDLGALRAEHDEGFLLEVRAGAIARVRSLSGLPAVAADPALSREAALLGAHDFAEAVAAEEAGRPDEARAFLEAAQALTPRRVEVLALLGRARYAAGDRAGAIRALHSACAGWPVRPDCAYYAAEMYASEGNAAQARIALAEALRRDPLYAPAARLRDTLR